ncbi:MAG: O-methyltransferase [Anaerolineae bacterium]|nr:O-methyltransferase [Anaerolineae bacterium]
MNQAQWTAVDQYINDLLIPSDPVLEAALQAAEAAKLPSAQVAPNQGKLLAILAQSIKARSILEIGTLGGYSTIWLARALPPDGKLITLEVDPKHAEVARANLIRAEVDKLVEVRVGPALDTLPKIAAEGHAPFDFVFIDADKANNTNYFNWALKLTHLGSVIIVDNVIRNGEVVDANSTDPSVRGVRQFNTALAAESRVMATQLQTVGSKGYDGFAMALVIG